jgi:hypothetical protein
LAFGAPDSKFTNQGAAGNKKKEVEVAYVSIGTCTVLLGFMSFFWEIFLFWAHRAEKRPNFLKKALKKPDIWIFCLKVIFFLSNVKCFCI